MLPLLFIIIIIIFFFFSRFLFFFLYVDYYFNTTTSPSLPKQVRAATFNELLAFTSSAAAVSV
jgi:hypothetical protein